MPSPNTYRTVNVISKEDFEKITPPVTRASNPDVPPPPPGLSSAYDEEVFVMEDDAKPAKDNSSTSQKSVGSLDY